MVNKTRFCSAVGRLWALAVVVVLALTWGDLPLGHSGKLQGQEIDWSQWRRLPLFEDGRIKPLDTFSRQVVEKIVGRQDPTLAPPLDADGQPRRDHPLFLDGQPKRWNSAELLFSWLVEADKWEDVPFLAASHETLRHDLLGVPVMDRQGHRLKYVSPRDVEKAVAFEAYLRDLNMRREEVEKRGERFRMSGLDLHAARLWNAYATFRLLVFAPRPEARPAFDEQVKVAHPIPERILDLAAIWEDIYPQLQQLSQMGLLRDDQNAGENMNASESSAGAREVSAGKVPPGSAKTSASDSDNSSNASSNRGNTTGDTIAGDGRMDDERRAADSRRSLVDRVSVEFADLVEATKWGQATIAELDRRISTLQPLLHEIARQTETLRNRAFATEIPDDRHQEPIAALRSHLRRLADTTLSLSREAEAILPTLYDTGTGPHVLPAVIPACIAGQTDAGKLISPWLSLSAVLYGSENVLRGYDASQIAEARRLFQKAAQAYRDRNVANRSQVVAENINAFIELLGQMGRAIEAQRQQLPLPETQRGLLALTAYPPSGLTDTEVFYNEFDPFRWAWITNLVAFVILLVGVGPFRRFSLWTGLAVLMAAQVITMIGFGLRVAISGWAPVTNMFESIVFVSLVIGVLGIWFVIQPIVGKAIRDAWTWVSLPFEPLWRETNGEAEHRTALWSGTRVAAVIFRLAMGIWLFYYLAIVPYDVAKSRAVFDLVPEIAQSLGNPSLSSAIMSLLGWFAGICVLLSIVWLAPRLTAALILAVFWTVPRDLRRGKWKSRVRQALARRPFAVSASALAFLTVVIAYFTPVWDKGIDTLQPVLRDRLWLFAHVLTITAGYGAGLLAWGLGNIALGYYLLGGYRVSPPGDKAVGSERHHAAGPGGAVMHAIVTPPEACYTLSYYMYNAIQVAVVFLIAGTVLGGVWADRAWGRFWGWDPKEVWALICILVYMALLHGRYVGWVNTFGMAAGSVAGMIAVVWAWYGTNYLMPAGLHAYAGEGAGGGPYIVGAFTANLLLVLLAWIRYRGEMAKGRAVAHEASSSTVPGQSASASPGSDLTASSLPTASSPSVPS